MSEPSEEQKRNYFVLALVVAYIVIALGNHHFRRLLVYKKNKKILEAQIAELDEKNRELEKCLEEFEKNPEKVYYRIAREEYGMIKKGELKYRFIDKPKK